VRREGRRRSPRGSKIRRALFEEIERAALRPLPTARFAYAERRRARVNIDYHVAVDGHLYSVPSRTRSAHFDSVPVMRGAAAEAPPVARAPDPTDDDLTDDEA
jgi:hypothetical protein